jgi:hypothetical protein
VLEWGVAPMMILKRLECMLLDKDRSDELNKLDKDLYSIVGLVKLMYVSTKCWT